MVAIVFSVLNFFLGWLIRVLLFMPAILTLGLLFLFMPFIVNTILLWLTDKLLGSFEIETFGACCLGRGHHPRQRRLPHGSASARLPHGHPVRGPTALDLTLMPCGRLAEAV